MARVAVVRPEDYERLATFMAAFPGVKPCTAARWRSRMAAWWDRNPAFQESFPRGWVVDDDGTIAGFFGSIPLKMQLGGTEATVFCTTTWRVAAEHRGKTLELKLRQLKAHEKHLHFSTTPMKDLVPLLQRFKYRQVERGPDAKYQSQLIFDCANFWRVHYRDRPGVARLATVVAPALAAFQAIRTRGLKDGTVADVRELTHADAAFDALWQRTRTRFANTNVRTAETVNWYCFTIQPVDRKLFAAYVRGELVGYLVLLVKEEPMLRYVECVDAWIDPATDEAAVLAALLARAADAARRENFDRLMFPHFDAHTAALLRALGLIRGPAWERREYYKGPAALMDLITPENSYFVRAQGDYGL